MTPEQALLQRARMFEMAALAEIYDAYSPAIYRYAMRLVNDGLLAEDCVTETFSRLLGALKADKGPQDFLKAYLFRVAHNWINDQWRASTAGGFVSVPLDDLAESQLSLAASDHAPESSPTQLVFERIDAEQVRGALRTLTPDQRQVIVLKFYEDLTNEEVADAIGKPVSAVKSLQHRALASLRRLLAEPQSANLPEGLPNEHEIRKVNLREVEPRP